MTHFTTNSPFRLVLVITLLVGCLLNVESQQPPPQPKRSPAPPPRLPEGAQVLRDVAYVPDGHERQKLDLYVPKDAKDAPLIVWVHGGGWQNGSKDRCPALPYLDEGYAVASVNYRLSHHAVFPAQLEDFKAAIRWLRANAARHGIDGNRIGVWGSSAGGHLVALLGTTGDVKEFDIGTHAAVSSRVQAVCDYFGPTDFLLMDEQAGGKGRFRHDAADSPESKLIGGPIRDHPDKVARANPVTYVSPGDAPFLIIHGDADHLVPVGQSRLLEAALKQAGVPCELVVLEGAGHGGREFNEPENQARVRAFFARHVKAAK
jgi:acetyl esterase/lipase